jgi:hypothetical protein
MCPLPEGLEFCLVNDLLPSCITTLKLVTVLINPFHLHLEDTTTLPRSSPTRDAHGHRPQHRNERVPTLQHT